MEISLFYTKAQRDTLWESGLDPEMVYFLRGEPIPESKWAKVDRNKLGTFPGLVDVLKQIGETKRVIDPVVDALVNTIEFPKVKEIVEYVTRSPSWRERPLIMKLTAEALGSSYSESLVYASAGVELFEESAILLDDVLDEQEMCVGKETAWMKYGIKETFAAHGVLSSLARSAILKSCKIAELSAKEVRAVVDSFEEIFYSDYIGQYEDLMSEKQSDFSEDDYFEMISQTPGTQFANALEIVCILTNREETKADLKEFGRAFGMAAQLRDDIIDIVGDEEVVYKKLLTDIVRRKKRLPLLLLLKRDPDSSALVTGDMAHDEDLLREIVFRIHNNEIVEACVSRVTDLANTAIKCLDKLEDNPSKKLLVQLTSMLASFVRRR